MNRGLALGFAAVCAAAPGAAGQQLRAATWGAWESVTAADDWTVLGGRLTWISRRGDALFAGAERTDRFADRDGAVHGGGVWHAAAAWWLSLQLTAAPAPAIVPRNAWEVDATARPSARTAFGVTYRRWNYAVGAVDLLMPHGTVTTGRLEWEARLYASRNASDRTDLAGFLLVTRSLGRRAAGWIGAGAGRESYLVGAPPAQAVRALRTATVTAGVRGELARNLTVRFDATVVDSKPVLSRRGLALGLERRFGR